jgi:hypothetical protein
MDSQTTMDHDSTPSDTVAAGKMLASGSLTLAPQLQKVQAELEHTQGLLNMSHEMVAYHSDRADRELRRAHALGRELTITQVSSRTMVIDMVDAHRNSCVTLQEHRALAHTHPDKVAQEAIILKIEKDQIAEREAYVHVDHKRRLAAMRRELNNSLDTQAEQVKLIREQDIENICLQNDIDDRDSQIDYWKKKVEVLEEENKVLRGQSTNTVSLTHRPATIGEKRKRNIE